MPTVPEELLDSTVVRITGGDELQAADVFTRPDGKKAIAVDAKVSAETGSIVSSWNKNLRYLDMNASNGGVARGTNVTNAAWVKVFGYSGKGFISGFILNLDTFPLWKIRFVVDGGEVFDTNGLLSDDLTGDTLYDVDDITDQNQAYLGISKGSHDRFVFHTPIAVPIEYKTSVEIYVKRSAGAAQKKFRAGLMVLSKEG